ncbi:hypothetical protein QQF64_015105 [Cirrhinus molitorella]|uniref:Uncharacterized protein n=1 Tax=Cirrhinus molitorella TaxID=172907 RepID=A0ABR3NUD6_9TELE
MRSPTGAWRRGVRVLGERGGENECQSMSEPGAERQHCTSNTVSTSEQISAYRLYFATERRLVLIVAVDSSCKAEEVGGWVGVAVASLQSSPGSERRGSRHLANNLGLIDRRSERSVTGVVVDIAVLYPPFDLSLSLSLSRHLCFLLTHTLWRVSVCQADSLLSLVALGHWALSLCMPLCVCVAGAPGRPAAATEMISTSVQHSA